MSPMRSWHTLLQGIGFSCLLTLGAGSTAQDIPHIDAVGAYNHANVMSRPREASRASGPEQSVRKEISQEEMGRLVEGLSAGYRERLVRDGKVVADAWLERQAARLKEQYTTIK